MEKLYSALVYVSKLKEIAKNYTSYYAWGAFGAPANKKNRDRYKVPNANPKDFLFDCSGFAYKALPWGWCGDRSKVYGGAIYKKIPELETGNILAICDDVSTNFNKIIPGEVLYMKGHVGIYCGEGVAIECTSKWDNGILLSEVSNTGIDTGLNYKRKWLKHGKLPFIIYTAENKPSAQSDGHILYKIKPGDNLTKIARKFTTTVNAIVKLNDILNPNLIRAGKVIKIPR